MDFKLFYECELLLIKKDGKSSLYKATSVENNIELKPIEPLVDVTDIHVDEETGLVFSSLGLFTVKGEKVSDFALTDVEIIPMKGWHSYLIVGAAGACSGVTALIWNGKTIELCAKAHDCQISNGFVALQEDDCWHIYRSNGQQVQLAYQIPKDNNLFLGNTLVVCGTPGNYRMFSLLSKAMLCGEKSLIIASPTENFALCAEMSSKRVDAFYIDNWITFDDVDSFSIIDDAFMLFAINKKGKYFIYHYDGTLDKDFAAKYPNGVDFVACNNGVLLIKDGDTTNFYSNTHYHFK